MWYRLEHGAIHLNSAGTDLPSGTWIAVRESGWYDLAERPPQVQERGQIVGLLEKDDPVVAWLAIYMLSTTMPTW